MNKNVLYRILFLASMLIFVAACTRATRPVALPSADGEPRYPSDLRGANLYRVRSADSSLHILVYRGGTLASLGHNHVMSSKNVTGYVWLHSNLQFSGFDLSLQVNDLIVDDNAARQAEGPDFAASVPDDAKAGTQRNMLSEAVLDAAHYPRVALRSISISGSRDHPVIRANLTVKAQTREITVPVKLLEQGRQLQVSGEFEIKQSDFGIKPFSVALGTLQVQDGLKVKFELVALAPP